MKFAHGSMIQETKVHIVPDSHPHLEARSTWIDGSAHPTVIGGFFWGSQLNYLTPINGVISPYILPTGYQFAPFTHLYSHLSGL